MDFSEEIASQKESYDLGNSEGVGLMREAEEQESIETDKIQNDKFQSTYDSTDLNLTGPSLDDYDYAGEFESGNSFVADPEGGINLPNKSLRPATQDIAGFDAVTGEQYTSRYSDSNEEIKQGISELQESFVNTKSGTPPEDMLPLAKISRGMYKEGATYEDFVKSVQGKWSDQQKATVWDSMKQGEQTVNDTNDKGKRHFDEAESFEYVRSEGVIDDIDESELVSSAIWVDSGRKFIEYFNPNGSAGMDDQEVHDFNMSLMSTFNYNIPMMMFYVNEITSSQDPELAKSFLYMMDQNDATNINMANVGRATAAIFGDVTAYATAGGSVLLSRVTAAGMKAGLKQTLMKVMAVTALDTAVGGATGAGQDLGVQSVEIAAGDKSEIDVGQAATAGAVSAAATTVLGVGAAAIADPALRKFGMGAAKDAYRKLQENPIPVGMGIDIDTLAVLADHTPKQVEFKSRLQQEISGAFDSAKGVNISVKKMKNKIKNWVNEGKIKQEEIDWSGINDLDSNGTVNRAEMNALIEYNRPTPYLDRTVDNSFADMSFGGRRYREYVITINNAGYWGGPMGHFRGQSLHSGAVVGEGNINMGHLRMEDSNSGGELGTMFLEGQSDMRKVKRVITAGKTPTAIKIKKSKDQLALDSAIKNKNKAMKGYDDFLLNISKKYNTTITGHNFLTTLDVDERAQLGSLMDKQLAAEDNFINANRSVSDKRFGFRSGENYEYIFATEEEMNKYVMENYDMSVPMALQSGDITGINRPEGITTPFTPYRDNKSSNDLLFRSAVMEAMNNDSQYLAWPKTFRQVAIIQKWDSSSEPTLSAHKSASEFMIKHMQRIAKNYGFKVEEFVPDEFVNRKSYKAYENRRDLQLNNLKDINQYTEDEWGMNYEDADIGGFIHIEEVSSPKETFNRIRFTKEQRKKWGEEGAAMYGFGAAAILGGGAASEKQKRNNKGQFK